MADLGDDNVVFRADEAASFLGVSEGTMKAWRRTGAGPRYLRMGPYRVVYRKKALIEFMDSREFQSTSEEREGERQDQSSSDAARSDEP